MNEEILLRLGFDYSAVRRGTMSMMDQQKKAASDYVNFWKKAVNEREQAEAAADVRAASRANRARALWRQRQNERTESWKRELNIQRNIAMEVRNARGVSLENLSRNVIRGGGHGGFSGGMNSTAMREMVTIAREASRGNWSRIPGSLSILLQSLGKLGTIARLAVNPATAAIGGAAAGVYGVYRMGYNATQTLRQANDLGFSAAGYQGFLMQAGREAGGREAAQSALGNLSQNIGAMRGGDMSQMSKFRRYGIATSANGGALTNEQIFSNVLAKYEGMSDPARRAAFAMDMFGESYKKFVRTLNEGTTGFAAGKKMAVSSGDLSVLGQVGSSIGNVSYAPWNGTKRVAGAIWNSFKEGYSGWAQSINPGLGMFARETRRGEVLDATEQSFIASGLIKPRRMGDKEFETLHPELAAEQRSSQMRVEDLSNSLEDRGKVGLSSMAEMGRRFTGRILPRQYTVTARMRTAMNIEDLEARANIAFMRGDDAGMKQFQGQADELRRANPWLAAMDRDPTRKINEQLIEANKYLKNVSELIDQVRSQK